VYDENKRWLKLNSKGTLFILSDELIIWSLEKNEIVWQINIDDIYSYKLTDYAVLLNIKDEKNIILRYKDNDVLYISLQRIIADKENLTIETREYIILNKQD
jgi:Neuraminidase (sialidase)